MAWTIVDQTPAHARAARIATLCALRVVCALTDGALTGVMAVNPASPIAGGNSTGAPTFIVIRSDGATSVLSTAESSTLALALNVYLQGKGL